MVYNQSVIVLRGIDVFGEPGIKFKKAKRCHQPHFSGYWMIKEIFVRHDLKRTRSG